MLVKPESTSHIGIRFDTLDALEEVLAGIEAAAAPGGELEGRIRAREVSAPTRQRPGDGRAR